MNIESAVVYKMRSFKQQKTLDRFDEVYKEFGDRVFAFCYRLSRNRADAEDLTQDVFLAAFAGRQRFQGRSATFTWLYRIAVYRSNAKRAADDPAALPLEERDAVGPDLQHDIDNRLELESALLKLPDMHRLAFLLIKAEGLTCKEAASVLEIPEGTVKFHVHQAVVRLRSELRAASQLQGDQS